MHESLELNAKSSSVPLQNVGWRISSWSSWVQGSEFRVSGDDAAVQRFRGVSHLRRIDCVYHSTLGLRVIKKKTTRTTCRRASQVSTSHLKRTINPGF